MPQLITDNGNDIIYGFTGFEDYRAFMRDEIPQLNYKNRNDYNYYLGDSMVEQKVKDPKWFGSNTTVEEIMGHITQFKSPELIESVYEKVKNRMPERLKSKLQERKLKFNPTFGVFSMDRFMMGMFKRYYSPVLRNFVSEKEVYEKDKKYYLKADNSEIEVKLSTNNKNVFAFFPQLDNDSHAVEIVVVAGANSNTSAAEMLYTSITGIIIAELCEKAGIKVRLNIAIGSNRTLALVPMKEFSTPIDRNIIALLSSDPRVFRYEMFKGIICNYNFVDKDVPTALGSLITEEMIEPMFEKYPKVKSKVFATDKVYYTSGIFNENAVYRKIDEILTSIITK